jgi:hypothetical protein
MPRSAASLPTRSDPRRAGLLVAALLVLGLAAVPAAQGAQATVAVPASPTFSATIDPFAQYEVENTCSPTAKPGALFVQALLKKTYGSAISSNIVRACTSADSGHEEGRALDWMVSYKNDAQRAMAKAFLGWLQATDSHGNADAMVRRLGIQYIIWNNRMWRAYDPSRGWSEYSNCLSTAWAGSSYDTTCHRNHIHLSFSWDGAYERTSFYSGYVACPSFPTPAAAPALPTAGGDFVAVTPRRVLNTATGTGSAYGACRVRAQTRFDVPVLGRGGVPASGVTAVVLRVTVVRPDSATQLWVWPTGTARTGHAVLAANPGVASALVTVPVGSGGKVSLQHNSGMALFQADVEGYYLAPGTAGSELHPMTRSRVVSSVTVPAGGSLSVDLGKASGVAQVASGLLSVSVLASTGNGSLYAALPGGPTPPRAAMSFTAGRARTSTVLARAVLGVAELRNPSTSAVTVNVDVQGVFAPASVPGGARFVPVVRRRLVDTQADYGVVGPMTAGRAVTFQAAGRAGVPSTGVAAVLVAGRAINPDASTAETMWPGGLTRPSVTQLTPAATEPAGDLMVVVPGSTGRIGVRNAAGTTDLTVDAAGYFL